MPDALRSRLVLSDYETDPITLAKRLIGCTLVRIIDGEELAGKIVETEAYVGVKDRASHAYGGRRTARNEAMYARAGTAYVYFTYGMHFCMNVVCGRVDEPVAVLLRALQPIRGIPVMQFRRGPRCRRQADLCNGPGKLCQALGIDRTLNRIDLTTSDHMWIEPDTPVPTTTARMVQDRRVGIASAGLWANRLLRWYSTDSDCVSVLRKQR